MYNCGNPSVRSEWDESLISRLLDCRTHPVRYCIVTTTITPGKEASMNWYLCILVWWPAGHVRLRFASSLIKLLPVITQYYNFTIRGRNPVTKGWEICHSFVWIQQYLASLTIKSCGVASKHCDDEPDNWDKPVMRRHPRHPRLIDSPPYSQSLTTSLL